MAKDSQLYDIDEIEERIILVCVDSEAPGMSSEDCLKELKELGNTAGAVTVGEMIQKRGKPHPGHYIGKGKVEELQVMIDALDATGVVCDDELSPAQLKNLSKMLSVKVMDRTMLILDIFAKRAISREGKIQVELAQLKYRLSRLAGLGASMSRLGGGIGTRGPGEKKLETDRRYIKDRITELNGSLTDIQTHRKLLRDSRDRQYTPIVSLVGYTDAGKSSILNALTDAGVLAEEKLFATLDTTTRKVTLPGGSDVMLTDTVGFIQKLPHHLIQAFRATLEELTFADVLLHVVDSSNKNREDHMVVVYKTLKNLGCEDTPVITVFNKIDKECEMPFPEDKMARATVKISATTGEGLENMLSTVEIFLKGIRNSMKVLIPYTQGQLLGMVHGSCEILSEEHTGDGVLVEAYVNDELKNRLKEYVL